MVYKCANCGEVFFADEMIEDPKVESARKFGNVADVELVIVCDDCYQERIRAEQLKELIRRFLNN